ncbi:unnamed protein product [Scytosiphon promiscuus]
MHAEDKAAAAGWLPFMGRVPEVFLRQVELAGGSLGSFLAQRVFRHKISKLPYQRGFCQVLIVQIAASVAWGYCRGASWGLAGVGLASAVMFVATAIRMSTLKEWQQRRDRGGDGGGRWRQPWQKPVDASAPGSRRRNTRPKGWIPFK